MSGFPALPARDPRGHKGTFGTVCVVGGQCGNAGNGGRVMIGGPALATLAALRVGAGLAVLAVPEPLAAAALTITPSATGIALPVDGEGRLLPSEAAERIDAALATPRRCLAIGPGLGAGPEVQQIVARLCSRDDIALVIDADALNALAKLRDFAGDLRTPAILTPHPGEYARLAAALGLPGDPMDPASRPAAAEMLARRLGCVVVLKGAGTVVTDGLRTWTCDTGNATLATAGTGDVLTGMIAGLVAQFAEVAGAGGTLGLLECAMIGVRLHGRVADRWAERHGDTGLLASDLAAGIPAAIAEAVHCPAPIPVADPGDATPQS